MATYKYTLKMCYKCYPTLYINELDVLDQLFFTIGNGYEWRNGQICHSGVSLKQEYIFVKNRRCDENVRYQKQFDESKQRFLDFLAKANLEPSIEYLESVFEPETDDWQLEQQKEYEKRMKYAKDPVKWRNDCYFLDANGNLLCKVYPISEKHSFIMNIPDNVKPDWLEAAKKTIQYCDEGKFLLTESDKAFIDKARLRIKELE
jgi:hypothetical protein